MQPINALRRLILCLILSHFFAHLSDQQHVWAVFLVAQFEIGGDMLPQYDGSQTGRKDSRNLIFRFIAACMLVLARIA